MAFNSLISTVVQEEINCKWTVQGKCHSNDPESSGEANKQPPAKIENEKCDGKQNMARCP